jgi:hypothetical protein
VTQGAIINTANTPVRPDRVGSGSLANPTVNQWFNPDAFHLVSCNDPSLPELCHYGNSGNSILEGPGFKNIDASLFKNFPVTERLRIQFRAEFFNLFNTPQFGRPNSGLSTTSQYLPRRNASGGIDFPSQANIVRGPGAITSLVAPMRNIQFGLKTTPTMSGSAGKPTAPGSRSAISCSVVRPSHCFHTKPAVRFRLCTRCESGSYTIVSAGSSSVISPVRARG